MSTEPAPSAGPRRADAQRNRERVLEVAAAELARDPQVALNAIAKRAGVGQGTFYRNFPDRDALLWAVYHHEVERLVTAATDLLDRHPPAKALREWLSQLARFATTKSDLGRAMNTTINATDAPVQPGYALVADTITTLLDANRDAGAIRPDITRDDFLLAIAGIWQLAGEPDPTAREARAEKLMDLVVAGLRPDTDQRP
ncbi:TetR/AcrR family transcriptional regulator [Nocardioides sp. BYT-33-1]|uniref:TetR/AcrR family transcriptional regulator n=1 Tax=Nocardioides sp. BYT-33-1 TaxID=3416952 RepID=UPI003F52AC89